MTNKNPKAPWLNKLSYLLSPLAIGLYLSLFISAYAYFSYYPSLYTSYKSTLNQNLSDFDNKTLDLRLNTRGLRKGSPDVAILAVDDRSIDIVGRWPWPREKNWGRYTKCF
jgi:hypothetical protein